MVAALTIARVDFRTSEEGHGHPKGALILSVVNDPTNPVDAARFARFVNCYELGSGTLPATAANIVAISRITQADGKTIALPLDKAILIDGEKFGLTEAGIGSDPAQDKQIYLTRLTAAKRVVRLSRRSAVDCQSPGHGIRQVKLHSGQVTEVVVPLDPNEAQAPIYLGESIALKLVGNGVQQIPVTMEVTFRSPEGLFRYLGAYLANHGAVTLPVGGRPLFTLALGRNAGALAQVKYRGQTYGLVNEPATGTRNAQIFTLLQQLINLHKEASDRPTVIPVRAIP